MSFTQKSAELLSVQVLTWLAGNEDLMGVFLGSTGAAVEDMAELARDPDFLGAVLDFLLMNDAWVQAFCDAQQIPYEHPMRARAALPGGDQINWT